jgi:hypothetical protein
MPFQATVSGTLDIDGVLYCFAEHPAAPGMPYGQQGRQATVYQLVLQNGEKQALKVFKLRFQAPSLVTLSTRIAAFTDLPGLRVCQRTVLTARRHTSLLRQYPDLTYAVLMPWIEGPTWTEVMLRKRQFTAEQSLQLARSFVEVLAAMEERGVAHCDLSGPNVLLPGLAEPVNFPSHSAVELVDVEQMCGPGLERPEALSGGSLGYAHHSVSAGSWESKGDRFAGAVMLAEMLGWCDERLREAAWGESYFEPLGMQTENQRFDLLLSVLRQRWGDGIPELFQSAWASDTLADCPTFGHWLVTLPVSVPAASPVVAVIAPSEVLSPRSSTTEAEHSTVPAAKPEVLQEHTSDKPPRLQLEVAKGRLTTSTGTHGITVSASAVSPWSEAYATPSLASATVSRSGVDEVDRLFDDGLVAYRQGDWLRARELFAEVVRQDPSYGRGKNRAVGLLAEIEKKRGIQRIRAGSKWTWLVPALLLVLLLAAGGVAVYQLQADSSARAQATATAQAKLLAASLQAQATSTARVVEQASAKAAKVLTSATAYAASVSTQEAQATETTLAQAEARGHAMSTALANETAVAGQTATAQSVARSIQTATAQAQVAEVAQATEIARTKATAQPLERTETAQVVQTTQAGTIAEQKATSIAVHQTKTAEALARNATRETNGLQTSVARSTASAHASATSVANYQAAKRTSTARAVMTAKARAEASQTADALGISPELTAPQQLEPPDGAEYRQGKSTGPMMQWSPVPGAVDYVVEYWEEILNNPGYSTPNPQCTRGSPCSWHQGNRANSAIAPPWTSRIGWRVWALDSLGRPGPKSEWREFTVYP